MNSLFWSILQFEQHVAPADTDSYLEGNMLVCVGFTWQNLSGGPHTCLTGI